MKNFIFNRAFQLGFWIAMLSFVIFNAMTFTYKNESRVRKQLNVGGFPLDFYEWGGYPYVERFLPLGIAVDSVVAVIYSFIIGSVLSFFWIKDLQKTRDELAGKL